MRIHHLDLGSSGQPGGRPTAGVGRGALARLTGHALPNKTPLAGLVPVDAGFRLRDVARPSPRQPALTLGLLRPRLDPGRDCPARRAGVMPLAAGAKSETSTWRPLRTPVGRRGGGATFCGLRAMHRIPGLPPGTPLVPIPGHTPVHGGGDGGVLAWRLAVLRGRR